METELTQRNPHTDESHHRHVPEITPPPKLPAAPPRTALRFVGVLLLVLLVAGLATIISRRHDDRVLAKETEAEAIPSVAVVRPISEKPDEELVLPATLQAYQESPIYARTNGYLLKWYKDIGTHVHKGDLLAKIDTPEVDQELSQARAARQQTEAQLQLARISADRWENLRKSDSVSQQEADQQTSGYQQSQANLAASDANAKRLEELESFKNVYAPYDGVITRRNVDPGVLITAGSGGREMFNIAQVDPLRVFVNVPQADAVGIHRGQEAWVTLQEYPGKEFRGTVARTADAIDPTSRTLLTEVDLPNKDGKLLPGSYGQVHFKMRVNSDKVIIPVNAMLFRTEGPRVAVVNNNNKVELRPITIGRDYGATLEILGGVEVGERIVVNPADSLEQGQPVKIAQVNQVEAPAENGRSEGARQPGSGSGQQTGSSGRGAVTETGHSQGGSR